MGDNMTITILLATTNRHKVVHEKTVVATALHVIFF